MHKALNHARAMHDAFDSHRLHQKVISCLAEGEQQQCVLQQSSTGHVLPEEFVHRFGEESSSEEPDGSSEDDVSCSSDEQKKKEKGTCHTEIKQQECVGSHECQQHLVEEERTRMRESKRK